jgi:hypothetical protein
MAARVYLLIDFTVNREMECWFINKRLSIGRMVDDLCQHYGFNQSQRWGIYSEDLTLMPSSEMVECLEKKGIIRVILKIVNN